MLDADRGGLTGYSFIEYVAKECQDAFLDHVGQCVRQRSEVTSEFRLVSQSGQSITAQLRSIPILGPADDTLCKTAITDITERRKMEEAIRQSRAFLQTVIDAIPETMLVVGRDYRISLANRAARQMAGGIDPTVCMTCHQFSHHRELPCGGANDRCPLREVIRTKAPVTVTHTHYNAEGDEMFVEVSAAPVFDELGEVTHVIESCRDVTDRKRAEKALEQDRNLLRTLIDNLPDCIYVKDVEGHFLTANLATARLMGVGDPNDLLGKTDFDFYPADQAADYRADEESVLQSRQPLVHKSEPRVNAGGIVREVMTTKIPLKDGQGRVFGLVGISRDLTERKQAEEAMRVAQGTSDRPSEPS